MSSLASTVESLSGLIRSSGLANSFSNPSAFASNGSHLHSLNPAAGSPPVGHAPRHPVRLDNDFNARSPSNMMHWDHAIMSPESTLGPLLAHTSSHLYRHDAQVQPQPPTIPSVSFSVATPASSHSYSSSVNSLKRPRQDSSSDSVQRDHPPLPNYRAPPHPISQCPSCRLDYAGIETDVTRTLSRRPHSEYCALGRRGQPPDGLAHRAVRSLGRGCCWCAPP